MDMANLTTAQKAPIIVKQEDGTPLTEWQCDTDDHGVAVISGNGFYVSAVAPGTTTLTVTSNGQTGSVPVSVSAAPLVVTLGEPQPK